jgi:hypothetical protein
MPTVFARQRRLRNVVEDLLALQLDLEAKELRKRLGDIQARANRALEENLQRGNPMIELARAKAVAANRQIGKATEKRIRPILKELRAKGFTTYEGLAKELNRLGIRPPVAKAWSKSSVRNIETRHPGCDGAP